jgi:hypothetical protein
MELGSAAKPIVKSALSAQPGNNTTMAAVTKKNLNVLFIDNLLVG